MPLKKFSLKNKTVLITAGPTREYIDPVRYISNDSSGQMGVALALAARDAGAKVVLVAGPINIETPRAIKRIDVISAEEMHREVMKNLPRADIVVCAAAVADWKIENRSRVKIKKIDGSEKLKMAFVKTPDILADVCTKKRKGQFVLGFALETNDVVKNAKAKLRNKGCDYIFANHANAISSAKAGGWLISRDLMYKISPRSKRALSKKILSQILPKE